VAEGHIEIDIDGSLRAECSPVELMCHRK
jgi:hypothetical protein